MNGCTSKYWTRTPMSRPITAPARRMTGTTTAAGIPRAEQLAQQDAGERHHRAHRQVDPAGEDDERHAHREDQQVGVVEQQRRHVAAGVTKLPKYSCAPISSTTSIPSAAKVGISEACRLMKRSSACVGLERVDSVVSVVRHAANLRLRRLVCRAIGSGRADEAVVRAGERAATGR